MSTTRAFSESPIVIGVATIPERREFFEEKCLPSLIQQADEVYVYHDKVLEPEEIPWEEKVSRFYSDGISYGDAGKFLGSQVQNKGGFYYFSCDDDLVYPPDYCRRMIEWIDHMERKAVVSLHGSVFDEFPISSYYRIKTTYFCLQEQRGIRRVLFPGTGVTAFHSDTVWPHLGWFKTRNMADVWFGLELQKRGIPTICLPHSGDYLTYNTELKLEDTIWGEENKDDFVQTALVNQFSLDHGFRLPPLPAGLPKGNLPPPLVPEPEPHPLEL